MVVDREGPATVARELFELADTPNSPLAEKVLDTRGVCVTDCDGSVNITHGGRIKSRSCARGFIEVQKRKNSEIFVRATPGSCVQQCPQWRAA